MARTIEHAGRNLGRIDAFRLRHRENVFHRICIEIDDAFGISRPDCDLVHIGVGCVQQRTFFRDRDHAERIRERLGRQRRAFERIERDIDGHATGANLLADIQHRRFVAFALAYHDRAVDRQLVESRAHRLYCGLVGRAFVAPADLPGGRNGRGFGDAHDFERELAVHGL